MKKLIITLIAASLSFSSLANVCGLGAVEVTTAKEQRDLAPTGLMFFVVKESFLLTFESGKNTYYLSTAMRSLFFTGKKNKFLEESMFFLKPGHKIVITGLGLTSKGQILYKVAGHQVLDVISPAYNDSWEETNLNTIGGTPHLALCKLDLNEITFELTSLSDREIRSDSQIINDTGRYTPLENRAPVLNLQGISETSTSRDV